MKDRFGSTMWLPMALTVMGLFVLVFGIAALVSNTWADLAGLFYLMASPVIHRGLKSAVRDDTAGGHSNRDWSPAVDADQ